jgi:hypothetical protein
MAIDEGSTRSRSRSCNELEKKDLTRTSFIQTVPKFDAILYRRLGGFPKGRRVVFLLSFAKSDIT